MVSYRSAASDWSYNWSCDWHEVVSHGVEHSTDDDHGYCVLHRFLDTGLGQQYYSDSHGLLNYALIPSDVFNYISYFKKLEAEIVIN